MPTTSHDKLYNKSVTNLQQFDNPKRVYDKFTTIQVERLESEHDKKASVPAESV